MMILLRAFSTAMILGYYLRGQLIERPMFHSLIIHFLIYSIIIIAFSDIDYKTFIITAFAIIAFTALLTQRIVIKDLEWPKIIFGFVLLIISLPGSFKEEKYIKSEEYSEDDD